MNAFPRLAAIFGVLVCLTAASVSHAQQEFPPPQGKGRVVVLSSGMSGPAHYTTVAREIAELGYDVVLYDGNEMSGTHGDGVKTDILEAQQMPHALPGKVALVGFSLGGGMYLYYGAQWSDLVSGAVLWCPGNSFIHDVPGFVSRLKVPLLVFAAAKDRYRHGCCMADLDSTLAAASTAAGKPFKLIVYPDADHDFVKGGDHYNPTDYADAFKRMADSLKVYLGLPFDSHVQTH
jgi:dienelactone hydrolase